MAAIESWIRRLLPEGSREGRGGWSACPVWPPDAFAIAASLVHGCGGYSQLRYSAHLPTPHNFFSRRRRERIIREAQLWKQAVVPESAERSWRTLWAHRTRDAADPGVGVLESALELMVLADEASSGIGFIPGEGKDEVLAHYAAQAHHALQEIVSGPQRRLRERLNRLGLWVPHSHCIRVPPEEVCVHPKATTPQVGCTIRYLTHHLALLPAVGEIQTQWILDPAAPMDEDPLNLLLVPFPYTVDSSAFEPSHRRIPGDADFFMVRQRWLEQVGRTRTGPLDADQLFEFVRALIDESGAVVHGVVFPELSLTIGLADGLAERLQVETKVQFLIAGVTMPPARAGQPGRNAVFTSLLRLPTKRLTWVQYKHHRWRLDRGQIESYELQQLPLGEGSPRFYWEDVDISDRSVTFWPVRHGAVAGTLICEDLARIDPVHTVFRAAGPNLVFALLMDGPQLERRWPGRYATQLADDPGCAVLTVNSLALIRRSERTRSTAYQFSLWKEPNQQARELEIDRGAHALLLVLRCANERNYTLDGRDDHEATVRFRYKTSWSCTLGRPPDWATYA